jgi:hypothetical protein
MDTKFSQGSQLNIGFPQNNSFTPSNLKQIVRSTNQGLSDLILKNLVDKIKKSQFGFMMKV